MLTYSACGETIHKSKVEEDKGEEATIRQHVSLEEEMPSVTLRRADFKDRRTELTAFSDKKPSVRKATADRDGQVVMSVDSEGNTQKETPEEEHMVDVLPAVEAIVCDEGQWQCKDGSGCIRHSVLCDGLADCHDHSDEEKVSCAKGNFAQVLAHEARKAEINMDEEEQKRYEVLSVPGYIPPPREHYADFYEQQYNIVKRFPRITDPNNTMVEVWFMQAPLGQHAMARQGATHTGVGFIGRDVHSGEELFRRDYQYWAADFQKTYGPTWLKNGELELNDDGDRAAFRARAMVSSTRTHGRWSPDWKKGGLKLEKITDITGYKFNDIMKMVDKFGLENKYWQGVTVKRQKYVIQPAVTCHEFAAKILSMAMEQSEDVVWSDKRVAMQRTTYDVSEHQLTRDPLRCLAPYVDPIDGVGSVLDKAQMYNARFLFSFFMGKKLTLPQRYMSDGSALEESDFPAECQEFRIKKIVTEITGPQGVAKEEIKAPRAPAFIRNGAQAMGKAAKGIGSGIEAFQKSQLAGGFAKTLVEGLDENPVLQSVTQATKSVLEVAEDALKG